MANVFARRPDLDRLEPPDQRAVLLDVLVVVARRRRTDALDLAARQRGLEDVRRVERALGRSRADERMDLVDEDDHVVRRRELGDDPLEPLLELAAVLRARDDERQVEGQDALVQQGRRDFAVDDPRGQPLDDRGLAHARLAQQHRVVLAPARQHLHDPLELGVATDQRIEHAALGHLRQIARELVEERRLLLLLRHRSALVDLHRVFANRVEPHPALGQKPAGGRVLQAQQSEQDVLGSDRRMHQPLGFFLGVLQGALGLLAERDLDRRRELLARRAAALELGLQQVHRDVRPREQLARRLLAFLQQAEQQVLGPDHLRTVLARLVLGEEQDPLGLFGELLEHGREPSVPRNSRKKAQKLYHRASCLFGLRAGEEPVPGATFEHPQASVFQAQDAIAPGGEPLVVSREHKRERTLDLQFAQQCEYTPSARRVQVPGRLVGQQDLRPTDQRPRDRNSLLLPARERGRPVGEPGLEAQPPEDLVRRGLDVGGRSTHAERHGHVLGGRELRQQMVELEHESHDAVAELGPRPTVETQHVPSAVHEPARLRTVETAQHVQERRFPDAGVADDRDRLACGDRQVEAPEDLDPLRFAPVRLAQPEGAQNGLTHAGSPRLDRADSPSTPGTASP
jgi:hypothetical protein